MLKTWVAGIVIMGGLAAGTAFAQETKTHLAYVEVDGVKEYTLQPNQRFLAFGYDPSHVLDSAPNRDVIITTRQMHAGEVPEVYEVYRNCKLAYRIREWRR
jgi:hypothetical protein